MEGHVEIISREFVKPSSQTQNHPTKVKRSYLDHLVPHVYFPFIFFYESTTSTHIQTSLHLKHTLSHTLNSFYPLAGRIGDADDDVVDCNDEGVEFVDARIHARLTDALKHPDMEDKLKICIPVDSTNHALCSKQSPLLLIQLSSFDCGGIALAIAFAHHIADCKSIMMFIDAWTSIYVSKEESPFEISKYLASFELAKYFPDRELPPLLDVWKLTLSDQKFRTKRFVFDKKILEALKKDATSSSHATVKDPTRVELISAFIWKHVLEVAKTKHPESTRKNLALHAVNLRGRKRPSELLENVFGNGFMFALALAEKEDTRSHNLVAELRRSIRKIDHDYITQSQDGNNYTDDLFKLLFDLCSEREIVEDFVIFSSWSRFPLYEVDYGFGSPTLVCPTAVPLKNIVFLVKRKDGESIEAWVTMEQHNLQMIDNQINLIANTIVKGT